MLLTSEMEASDDEIIDMYRGLRRIEESFKVTKSELEARPVYVWTKEHIEAHFLICFVALTIARILENKLERKYSVWKNPGLPVKSRMQPGSAKLLSIRLL